MKIPVIVVDDQEADRYIVKRRLAKHEDFDELLEFTSGDVFLERFFNGGQFEHNPDTPLLVLMDINMPGRNGFQTVAEIEQRIVDGKGPTSIAVMMFTSSSNSADHDKAKELNIIKGYINKPLNSESIVYLRDLYNSLHKEA